ncbi:MAG: PepSY domain-containing protein [Eubacteriales bacterium]|nr:PepSY domain-containing protein [Eubacteriales bacterium]
MNNKRTKVFAGILAAAFVMAAGAGKTLAAKEENVKISRKEALEIAAEDAKVEKDEIERSRVEFEHEDGRFVYNVEFYTDKKEYDYEINAETGKILEVDFEIDREFKDASWMEDAKISEKEAQQIALEEVPGASEDDVYLELDYDDGRLLYEGEIFYDSYEYEFEINAETGDIESWEKESIWD